MTVFILLSHSVVRVPCRSVVYLFVVRLYISIFVVYTRTLAWGAGGLRSRLRHYRLPNCSDAS
jgi:hypothetical protein